MAPSLRRPWLRCVRTACESATGVTEGARWWRPSLEAVNRAKPRRLDRSIAAIAALVAGIVLAASAARAGAPVPALAANDPRAAAELVALMARGEHVSYVAEYAFTRHEPSGATLPATTYYAQGPRSSLTRSAGTLTIDTASTSYNCQLVGAQASCFTSPAQHALPDSQVLAVAIKAAPYDVVQTHGASIAGEHAECFTVRAHDLRRQLPDFGRELDLCLAADGVPLRRRVVSQVTDESVAAQVVRRFDDAALRPVLAGFEQAAARNGR